MARDFMKGDMPVLVLAVLAEQPCHGYAIARFVERESQQTFQLKEGTLYPTLRALEQDGLISGDWEVQPAGPARKVYHISEKGREELATRRHDWDIYVRTMQTLLGGKSRVQSA